MNLGRGKHGIKIGRPVAKALIFVADNQPVTTIIAKEWPRGMWMAIRAGWVGDTNVRDARGATLYALTESGQAEVAKLDRSRFRQAS